MKKSRKLSVLKRAFISSVPVLMGYSTMGFAAGVVLALHSGVRYPAFWGALTSGVCISGALQFMIADWIRSTTPLREVAILTFCLNIRYAMYGISLLERFKNIPLWKKLYLIWGLTDETYALEVGNKLPVGQDSRLYCLILTLLDHFYWIAGVTIGALAGSALPFPSKGIDFAMTALFLVILVDQCREKNNRLPGVIGGITSLFSCLIFGTRNMLIPAIILMISVFIVFRKKLDDGAGEASHE